MCTQIPHAHHSPPARPRLRSRLHDSNDARLPAHEPTPRLPVPQRARLWRSAETAHGEHIPAESAESEYIPHHDTGKQEIWGVGGTERGIA